MENSKNRKKTESSSSQSSRGFWGSTWHGIKEAAASRSVIFDAFIDTDREKRQRERDQFNSDRMTQAREQWKRNDILWKQQSEQYERQSKDNILKSKMLETKFAEHTITTQKNAAFTNIANSLKKNKHYQLLNEKQKMEFHNSPEFKDYENIHMFTRLYQLKQKSPIYKNALNIAANKAGIKLTEEKGKDFIEMQGNKIEINQQNHKTVFNKLVEAGAKELKLRAHFNAAQSNIRGRAFYKKVQDLLPITNYSYTKSAKIIQDYDKKFSPMQQHIHDLTNGIEQCFEDDTITEEEKGELIAQLKFNAQRLGIKHEDTANGIFVIDEKSGARLPISEYSKQLKKMDVMRQTWDQYKSRLNGANENKQKIEQKVLQAYPSYDLQSSFPDEEERGQAVKVLYQAEIGLKDDLSQGLPPDEVSRNAIDFLKKNDFADDQIPDRFYAMEYKGKLLKINKKITKERKTAKSLANVARIKSTNKRLQKYKQKLREKAFAGGKTHNDSRLQILHQKASEAKLSKTKYFSHVSRISDLNEKKKKLKEQKIKSKNKRNRGRKEHLLRDAIK